MNLKRQILASLNRLDGVPITARSLFTELQILVSTKGVTEVQLAAALEELRLKKFVDYRIPEIAGDDVQDRLWWITNAGKAALQN